ncbi:hypothetical protein SAMN05660845_1567 [Flavobacterium swingsii]|uniref:Uncharacterized protein n=1 Tax=Flavobacterium swingsii TaxID=498292 RepID=A0A1I0Y9Q8_9FLAO|nr:hypothetical protein SAMN05660845_1567 [Flavobacterium swingsii]
MQKFSGNHFLSQNGIYILIVFCFTISLLFVDLKSQKNPEGFITGMFLISFCVFAGLTYPMNYFILTRDEIIIKNPIWFWKNVKIPLKEIERISIDQPFRSPVRLNIECRLFPKKSFYGSSLRKNTWRNLKIELQKNKIIVDDFICQ